MYVKRSRKCWYLPSIWASTLLCLILRGWGGWGGGVEENEPGGELSRLLKMEACLSSSLELADSMPLKARGKHYISFKHTPKVSDNMELQ